MYPRASAWPKFIEDSFSIIKPGCTEPTLNDESLSEWRRRGGYFVKGLTKKVFHIDCAKAEFSSVMLAEIELLLDHITEQRIQVANGITQGSSPSWTLVSLYYWSVYAGLAWLRLVGRPLVYLYRDDIDKLVGMNIGVKAKHSPKTGTFNFLCDPDFDTGTRTNLQLQASNASNFHEGIWSGIENYFGNHINSEGLKLTPESRIVNVLCKFNEVPPWWPSQLRNAVNYRPGFSYRAVHGYDCLKLFQLFPKYTNKSLQNLVEAYELHSSKAHSKKIESDPEHFSEALILRTLVFDALLNELRNEIATRLDFSGKRQNARISFLRKNNLVNSAGKVWPYVSDW